MNNRIGEDSKTHQNINLFRKSPSVPKNVDQELIAPLLQPRPQTGSTQSVTSPSPQPPDSIPKKIMTRASLNTWVNQGVNQSDINERLQILNKMQEKLDFRPGPGVSGDLRSYIWNKSAALTMPLQIGNGRYFHEVINDLHLANYRNVTRLPVGLVEPISKKNEIR